MLSRTGAVSLVALWLTTQLSSSSQSFTPGKRVSCNEPPIYNSSYESVYDRSLWDIHHTEQVKFSEYRGDVLLIVNVASYDALTSHYYGLNALQTEFGSQGFRVIGVPSNIFNNGEPGYNGTEILNGMKYVRPGGGFVPNFQMFEMVDVNGEYEHPLYAYLKTYCPPTSQYFRPGLDYAPVMVNDVRWNWEKFLINRRGHVVYRYHHPMEPVKYIRDDIISLLEEKVPLTKTVRSGPGGDLFIG